MPGFLEEVERGLLAALQPALAGERARVVAEYPHALRPAPLRCTMVALGICDVQVLPCGMADLAGVDDGGQPVRGQAMQLTASLLICSPASLGSKECRRVYSLAADALLFGQSPYEITKLWCSEVSFDKELGALKLPCFARLRMTVLRTQQPGDGIHDFVIRRESQ